MCYSFVNKQIQRNIMCPAGTIPQTADKMGTLAVVVDCLLWSTDWYPIGALKSSHANLHERT